MKRLAILGATGSIGTQTLQVIDALPGQFTVTILAAHRNWQLLMEQTLRYQPACVVLTDADACAAFQRENKNEKLTVLCGMAGLLQALERFPVDMMVGAMSGAAGIEPTLKALELGIDLALANKETLVSGGSLVRSAQQKSGAKILPVDSEHAAIFQCIEPGSQCLHKILLTASGGPFRTWEKEALRQVTPQQALRHPNWSMGPKITIDSATLMNKGLEVIEANWLFNVDYDHIQVLVHPQSVVHSMVEYGDGSVLGHLGPADMRIPIQYALTWPNRQANPFPKLDFTKLSGLEFFTPDFEKFPALALAYAVGRTGKSAPAVLNGANEVAVAAFLQEKIGFLDIPALVRAVVERHTPVEIESFAHLMEIDQWARREAQLYVEQHSSRGGR